MIDPKNPIRVRVVRALPEHGLRAGQAAWVAGTAIEGLIEDGSLIDITNRAQLSRAWKVGGKTYTDEKTARRVGAALGQTPVEVF